MYGELHWKPWELKHALWVDVMLAIYGLREKDYYDQSILRRVAAAIAASGSNQKFARQFDKFWPELKQKGRQKNTKALEQLRRFKLLEAQKKHAAAGT